MKHGPDKSPGISLDSLARGAGTPVVIDSICDWLVEQALSEPGLGALFSGCGRRVHAAGIPLDRAMLSYSTLHPLYQSRTLHWTPRGGLEKTPHLHADRDNPSWLESPLRYMIDNRVELFRRRLVGPGAVTDFPVLEEFRDHGLTDYLAYLVAFDDEQDGRENPTGLVGSWATQARDGFADDHLRALIRIQRLLAVATKVRIKDEVAANVLDAYLGVHAGRKVLRGRIRRGDGERIHAVVWYSDLRDSTRLAGEMSHEAFLSLLNDYFECTAGAILERGGEVLRFVGDAVLAIFPVTGAGDEARGGVDAVAAARDALDRGNSLRRAGRPVSFGIGLHLGDVLYGNIGVPSRVEFSVIGPCANEVARIEDLTKKLSRPVLLSSALARVVDESALVDLGTHEAKGVGEPLHVFTLSDAD